MHSKEYLLLLAPGVRKRHAHVTERGRIIKFTVQLEIEYQKIWRQVMRYDTAHGFIHVDRYNIKNEQKKESLDMTFDEALTFADSDINENWEKYKIRFLQGFYP